MASTLALALSLSALPALADSTSSASSAASTSVGSSSASLETSSASSSSKAQVAQGQYTVVDLVAVVGQPEVLRVRLQAVATDPRPAFTLLVPRQAAETVQLARGQTVEASHRAYGVAFARVTLGEPAPAPFFLVLDDAWYRELQSRPVGAAAPI
ncbi:MAG: hypothetical protein CFE44_06240 [Burkholderiales bacterium PBB4]|nr:MAG: hypothetical protein CFE44_06240 [Burkholderiales bacterium PBB4]